MKVLLINLFFIIILGFNPSMIGIEKKYDLSLLIGLMNDYGGKQFLPNHPKEKNFITDFYFNQNKSLEQFKLAIIASGLEIQYFEFIKESSESPLIKVYSSKYVDLFNSFYRFRKRGEFYDDNLDKDFVVKIGKLKKNAFKNELQKLNFLRGCFIRNGREISENLYELKFSNSVSKYRLVKKFCQDLGIKIIDSRIKEGTPKSKSVFLRLNKNNYCFLTSEKLSKNEN